MNKLFDDIFLNNVPSLDLHGEDRSSSRVLIKEFIEDNLVLKNYKLQIIHGVGTGIIKEETHNILKKHKKVESFHINHFNQGCTIVYLKK